MHRVAFGLTTARILILFPLLVAGIRAQPVSVTDVAATTDQGGRDTAIERLLKRIDELESSQKAVRAELQGLLARPGAPAPSAPPEAASVIAGASVDASVADIVETNHTLGPVEFRGFSDFDYGRAWFEKLPPGGLLGSPRSFNTGDFDLFTNTRINEQWSVLAELLATSDFSNETSVELDRLLLTYRHNDYFQISFGKFNTAIGYYSTAFGRAQYFQTAIGKPIMYADEDNGSILPVHNIGITATGKVPAGSLGLHWIAEVANGTSFQAPGQGKSQNFVDENNGKAVNIGMYVRPEWLRGFQSGISVYRDTLHPTNTESVHQLTLALHVVFVTSRFEWLNEAATVRHTPDGTNQVYRSTTSYTQLSRAFGRFRPYFRYDYQNIPGNDPVFGVLGRRSGPSVGVNRRLSQYVFLKVQYGRLSQRNAPTANGFSSQLAFTF